MRVISRKALRDFADRHQEAETPLDDWYRTAKRLNWASLVDVRKTYPHADAVGAFTVFNIGGNKYRLIAKIEYRFQGFRLSRADPRGVRPGRLEVSF